MDQQTLPDLYVVTVNYRSRERLRELLASLAPLPRVRRGLIVNHSPEEDLGDIPAPFPVTVIAQANAGYGAGLNRGLKEITDPEAVVLLANPDVTLLTPGEVEGALAYLAAYPKVGCLIPRMLGPAGEALPACRTFYNLATLIGSRLSLVQRLLPRVFRKHFCQDLEGSQPREVDWGAGAAMLYRVAASRGGPAFDERFFLYFEDVDLCARLWRQGWSVVHYPRLAFRHGVQRQSRVSLRFFRYHLASLLKFMWKYQGLPCREDLQRRPM